MPTHVQRDPDFPGELYFTSTEPASPVDGDAWFDGEVFRRYVTDKWIGGPRFADDYDTEVIFSVAEPASPAEGDVWYDRTNGQFMRYVGAAFEAITSAGGGGAPADPDFIRLGVKDVISTVGATIDDLGTNGNGIHTTYEMPTGVESAVYFEAQIPASWNGMFVDVICRHDDFGGDTIVFSGEVREHEYDPNNNTAIILNSTSASVTDSSPVPMKVRIASKDLATIDADRWVQIRITREGNNVSDNVAESLFLSGLRLERDPFFD